MAGLRPSKRGMLASRPLLNLGGGDKSGLAKAFQALVGGKRKEPSPAAGPQFAQALEVLTGLGFQIRPGTTPPGLAHPLAPDRHRTCQPPAGPFDPESWALDWATRNFPEMEFYLPFILRCAALSRKSQPTDGRPNTPEPEYDDDGFLAEYP
jgi:hypothetical protein